MSLVTRVGQLERRFGRAVDPAEDCPDPLTGAIVAPGEPIPDDVDVAPCPRCGGRHVLILTEEVVEAAPPPG